MAKRPEIALKVNNLETGLDFFVKRIGFTLQEHQPQNDLAYVQDLDGDLILLAGPKVEDVKAHLEGVAFVIQAGEPVRFVEENLEARQTALWEQGFTDLHIEETANGDRTLSIHGPDNCAVVFVARAHRSHSEQLRLYEQGPGKLEALLEGLSEADLDLSRAPGQWSIRQIVHHMAEGEMLWTAVMKSALAQSGSTYIRNTYNQETWPETFKYATRPVASSVALLKALRTHVLELIQCVPDNEEHFVMMRTIDGDPEGRKVTIGDLIGGMAAHAEEHCEEIREIREQHGR